MACIAAGGTSATHSRARRQASSLSKRLYNDGKRPFGFDVVDGRLVPNANEQAALTHGLGMQANGDSSRSIAFVWMSEYSLDKFDATTIQRILERHRVETETVPA
jgi:hypothetical protein